MRGVETLTIAGVRRTAELVDDGAPATGSDLSDPELARWRRLRLARDRDDFVAARRLARLLVSALDGTDGPWRLAQVCDVCGGPHGRPRVEGRPELHVSWAHAQGLVAAAASLGPVGIDVELARSEPPFDDDPGPRSQRWLRWTRMEALVKRGDGTLDAALNWPLAGPPHRQGQAITHLLPGHPILGVLTDLSDADGAWVASVASTEQPAIIGFGEPLPTSS